MEKKAKYNVGDKVMFLDINNEEKAGTIGAVEWTQVVDWNKESSPLYLMSTYPYLRGEDDILDLYKEY